MLPCSARAAVAGRVTAAAAATVAPICRSERREVKSSNMIFSFWLGDSGMPNADRDHKYGFVIHPSASDMAASDLAIAATDSAISIRYLLPGAFAALNGT